MIIFLWKASQGLVQGFEIGFSDKQTRRGRTAEEKSVQKSSPAAVRKARECSLSIRGARIFNLLPVDIRNHDSNQVDTFKAIHDIYLSKLPEQPSIGGRSRAADTNSLLHQIPLMTSTKL